MSTWSTFSFTASAFPLFLLITFCTLKFYAFLIFILKKKPTYPNRCRPFRYPNRCRPFRSVPVFPPSIPFFISWQEPDRNGPKWSASVRGERGDGGTETDLNGRLLPGNKKGDKGRENRYGPKWPAPVGVCGVCDRNGPKWSASVRGKRGDGGTETDKGPALAREKRVRVRGQVRT